VTPFLETLIARRLRRLLPSDRVEPVLVDLLEDYRDQQRTAGRARAAWWLLRESQSLAAAYRRHRPNIDRPHASPGPGAWRELRRAVRALRHAPWYAGAVIVVLTLGIALSTTVFAVVDGVLFKPLPFPRSSELISVQVGIRAVSGPSRQRPWISASDAAAWRQTMPDVQLTIFRTGRSARFEEVNDNPMGVAEIEPHFFDVVGVRPLMGGFSADHFVETLAAAPVIISYELWQTRFAGAADIVGRRVVRGTASMVIVGVLPPGFVFPARQHAQVLMPLRLSALERTNPRHRAFEGIARIPAGATIETTGRRLEAAMAEVARSFPAPAPLPAGRRYANPELLGPFDFAALRPLDDWLAARPRALFLAVFISAAALVLLGCVNVSGLMAARTMDRQREIDLRRALGAGARDIARLVLAEAGVLAAAGTLLGLALAFPAFRLAMSLLPDDLSLLKIPAIDWRAGAFAALLLALSVTGVSIWPIRRGLRATGTTRLAFAARNVPRFRSAGRFVVVSAQIAIGLALTLGGALLVGSLVRLYQADIGIDARGVFAVEVRIPESAAGRNPGATEAILLRIVDGARSIPGVSVAGATDAPILSNLLWGDDGWKTPAGTSPAGYLNVHGVTPGFFEVVRPRLLDGRLPSNDELDRGERIVVVSQSIAARVWPGRSAVNELLEYSGSDGGRSQFLVVGVVADARFTGWDEGRFNQIYAPITAMRRGSTVPNLLLRTSAEGAVLAGLQPIMRAEGADVRAVRAMPLTTMFAETVRKRRFQSWLFGSFAAGALVIVGVGVLGLMAMTAARRTREVGVRMALGATKDSVIRLFVREQLGAVLTGVAAGCLVSAWAAKFLDDYLYGMKPYDVPMWSVSIALITATAIVGTLIPALRACRVDPATVLRVD
jgi:predicted permease